MVPVQSHARRPPDPAGESGQGLPAAPLTPEHGAPLRLAIPLKYGIKNIKRIGTIRFTDARPADYWAERGYDWYAGH